MPAHDPSQRPPSPRRLLIAAAILMPGLFWILAWRLSTRAAFESDPGEAARSALRQQTLESLRSEDNQRLESFAWIDRTSGAIQIPIALAMKVILPELRANTPKTAYPIALPQPSPTSPVAPP